MSIRSEFSVLSLRIEHLYKTTDRPWELQEQKSPDRLGRKNNNINQFILVRKYLLIMISYTKSSGTFPLLSLIIIPLSGFTLLKS